MNKKLLLKDREFSEHIRLSLLSVIVGIVAGLASVLFKFMIHFFQDLFWKAPSIIEAVGSHELADLTVEAT